jgi:hypothetical protein
MSAWTYNGEVIETIPEEYIGFVYLIEHKTTGMKYIGKKLAKKPAYRIIKGKRKKTLVESDWKSYFGSSKELQELVESEGPDAYNRTILHLCKKKGMMSYLEMKEQIDREVLFRDDYHNRYIGGKIHAKHL